MCPILVRESRLVIVLQLFCQVSYFGLLCTGTIFLVNRWLPFFDLSRWRLNAQNYSVRGLVDLIILIPFEGACVLGVEARDACLLSRVDVFRLFYVTLDLSVGS